MQVCLTCSLDSLDVRMRVLTDTLFYMTSLSPSMSPTAQNILAGQSTINVSLEKWPKGVKSFMMLVVTRYLIHPKYLYNWNDRSFHSDPRDLDRCTRSKGGTAFQRHSIFVWLSSETQSSWRVVYGVCAVKGQTVRLRGSPEPHSGISR